MWLAVLLFVVILGLFIYLDTRKPKDFPPGMFTASHKQTLSAQLNLQILNSHCDSCIRSTMDSSVGECPPRAQVAQANGLPLPGDSRDGKTLRPCRGAEGRQGPPGCLVWVWSHQGHAFSRGVRWQASGTILRDQDMGQTKRWVPGCTMQWEWCQGLSPLLRCDEIYPEHPHEPKISVFQACCWQTKTSGRNSVALCCATWRSLVSGVTPWQSWWRRRLANLSKHSNRNCRAPRLVGLRHTFILNVRWQRHRNKNNTSSLFICGSDYKALKDEKISWIINWKGHGRKWP